MPKTLYIVLISSLVVLFIAIILWPQYQSLQGLNLQIKEKKTELEDLKSYFRELEDISQELNQYSESLAKIDSAIPSDPSLPSLLRFLEKGASESGLFLKKIGTFTTAPVEKESRLKATSIDLELSGSYLALKNFLSKLEKTDRLIEVGNISFSSKSKESEAIKTGNIFLFTLQFKTHSY